MLQMSVEMWPGEDHPNKDVASLISLARMHYWEMQPSIDALSLTFTKREAVLELHLLPGNAGIDWARLYLCGHEIGSVTEEPNHAVRRKWHIIMMWIVNESGQSRIPGGS